MGKPLSVLLVEDNEDDVALLLLALRRGGFDPYHTRVETEEAMASALANARWDLVISDHSMPNFSAPAALRVLREKGFDMPFIIVSGAIGEEAAVAAMKSGAQDYLVKGKLARLPAAIERELKDVEERRGRRDAELKVHYLAYFDPLTKLPNRRSFCADLQDLQIKNPSATGAILGVKLDSLGAINTTLGYTTGDLVFAEIGYRLSALVSPPVWLARTSGADYALVLPDADQERALQMARDVHATLSQVIHIHEMEMEPATSIGITMYPKHGTDPETLLQCTSVALQQAAESATRVAVYDRNADPYRYERVSLIADLRRAIAATDQLHLRYQPKVDLMSRTLVGVEALIRWTHPRLGFLPPDQFIPLAEQTGLINALTRRVLRDAMTQSVLWQAAGLNVKIAVNLSVNNLQSSDLADHVAELVGETGVGADWITLELTESAIMNDESKAQLNLLRLHEQGFKIAIDDFGTGYSSFARLRQLPVSEIKIDKSFVSGMPESNEDRIIVDSIIALGHKLGMGVVAEGVETQQMWDMLEGFQCDQAQGYFLSRPLPATEMQEWVRTFLNPAVS